jgi:hypothetical protein
MKDDFLKPADKIRPISADLSDPYYSAQDREDRRILTSIVLATMGVVFGIVMLSGLRYCERQPKPAMLSSHVQQVCNDCHHSTAHSKLTEYFRPTSRNPEVMATAVLMTQSPRLMAAIAKVESGGNPHIKKGGYRGRHSGAFQVNPKLHGRVSSDPIRQALQSEAILSELTATMPIKKALSIYGGDSSSRYQRRVLAELASVPR